MSPSQVPPARIFGTTELPTVRAGGKRNLRLVDKDTPGRTRKINIIWGA